jgi:DNA-binding response OmpR family regulator
LKFPFYINTLETKSSPMNFSKSNAPHFVNRGYKILVVEDDPSLTEILEHLFNISGLDYIFLNDVLDIKAVVQKHQPDVVLLDYLLPSNNGGYLCQQLKNYAATAHIPIILYSAISKSLIAINEYKCDYFIEKPFDLDFLMKKINTCCEKNAK